MSPFNLIFVVWSSIVRLTLCLLSRFAPSLKLVSNAVTMDHQRQEDNGCATTSTVSRKAVLITNCDDEKGFGRGLAMRLVERGVHVFAACGSELAAAQLRQMASVNLDPIVIDVTNSASVKEAVDFVKHSLAPITVLWGIVNIPPVDGPAGLPAEMHTVDDNYRPLFEANLFGMASVTASFMPMLMANRGRVVNTCSLAGLVAIPNNISYVAIESAIVTWSEALRREKVNAGVAVSLVAVGVCRTTNNNLETAWNQMKRMWRNAPDEMKRCYTDDYLEQAGHAVWKSVKTSSNDMAPVINAYEKALFDSHPRRVYHVGSDVHLVAILSCLPRRLQDFLLPVFFKHPSSSPPTSSSADSQSRTMIGF